MHHNGEAGMVLPDLALRRKAGRLECAPRCSKISMVWGHERKSCFAFTAHSQNGKSHEPRRHALPDGQGVPPGRFGPGEPVTSTAREVPRPLGAAGALVGA